MSYEEYKNEFKNAQKNLNAPYRMFVFDLKNSRKMTESVRYDAQIKSVRTMKLFATMLLELEKQTDKKVLFRDERVDINIDFILSNPNQSNPCVCAGDSFAISVFNGMYSDQEMIDMFVMCAKKVDNEYPYSVAVANFETSDYVLATKQCYIGYCLAELSLNKSEHKIIINQHESTEELAK